jgi:hypothetical protein
MKVEVEERVDEEGGRTRANSKTPRKSCRTSGPELKILWQS